jgi:hypothetical protein
MEMSQNTWNQSMMSLVKSIRCEMPFYMIHGIFYYLPAIEDPPQHWYAAKFILSIKERHTLSQCAVDCVISSATSLMASVNHKIINELRMSCEVSDSVMQQIENKFEGMKDIFSGLSTAHQQRKYFRKEFHKIVSGNSTWVPPFHTN